jgi:hypothetical protein
MRSNWSIFFGRSSRASFMAFPRLLGARHLCPHKHGHRRAFAGCGRSVEWPWHGSTWVGFARVPVEILTEAPSERREAQQTARFLATTDGSHLGAKVLSPELRPERVRTVAGCEAPASASRSLN